MPLAVGVDIGGTKVAAGVVDDDGQVHRSRTAARPPGATSRETEAVIAEVVQVLAARHDGGRGRHRRGRLDRHRPGDRAVLARTWPGATSRCGMRWPGASGCR